MEISAGPRWGLGDNGVTKKHVVVCGKLQRGAAPKRIEEPAPEQQRLGLADVTQPNPAVAPGEFRRSRAASSKQLAPSRRAFLLRSARDLM